MTKPRKRIKSKANAQASSVPVSALLILLADIRAAVGDPTGKLMQYELVERCRKMRKVIDAARCIQHWHDRDPDGMVVSKEYILSLLNTLRELDNVKVHLTSEKGIENE